MFPGAILHLLRRDEIVPVASPKLLSRTPIRAISDLRNATLIVHRSRRPAWSEWLGAHAVGLDVDQPRIELEQFNMVFQAAIAGLGVAMVPTLLARQDLASGALVALFNPLVNDQRGDYLVYPSTARPIRRSCCSATGCSKSSRARAERRNARDYRAVTTL